MSVYFQQTTEHIVGDADQVCYDQLELALNHLVAANSHLLSEPWNCQVLMVFLDDAPLPSCFNNATFQLMKNKVGKRPVVDFNF